MATVKKAEEQSKKEIILFKLTYFVMMWNCGREDEARKTLSDAYKLIEEADIK